MKVLLTGATGLIGKSLGPRLVAEGIKVVSLSRHPEKARPYLTFPCDLFQWDGEREVPPRGALNGIDAIIHLAGENIADERWTSERKAHLKQSRVQSAVRLAEGLDSWGIKLKIFITASAVGYYGDRGEDVLTETSAVGSGFLADLCRDWERAAERVPAERTVKLRLGVVLSPYGGFLRQVVPLFERLGASRLGSGQHYFSWIHVDDLVEIIIRALRDSQLKGPVNAVAPSPVTNAAMTKAMAETLKVVTAPPVPALALKLRYGELASALLGSQRVVPQRLEDQGFRFRYPDLKSALLAIYPDLDPGELILQFAQWVPGQAKETSSWLSEKHLDKIKPTGQGLYRKWQTDQTFSSLGSGTLIQDRVRFQLSLGLVGRSLALGQALTDIETKFENRAKIIGEAFGSQSR